MITQDMVRQFMNKTAADDDGFSSDMNSFRTRGGFNGGLQLGGIGKKPKAPKSYEQPKKPAVQAAKPAVQAKANPTPTVAPDIYPEFSDSGKNKQSVAPQQSLAPSNGEWNSDFVNSTAPTPPQSKAAPVVHDKLYQENEQKINENRLNRSKNYAGPTGTSFGAITNRLQNVSSNYQRDINQSEETARRTGLRGAFYGQDAPTNAEGFHGKLKNPTKGRQQVRGTVHDPRVKQGATWDAVAGSGASGDPLNMLSSQLDEEATRGKRLAQKPVIAGSGGLKGNYAPQISQGGGRVVAGADGEPTTRVHEVENDPNWRAVEDVKTGKISYAPNNVNFQMMTENPKQYANVLAEKQQGISAEDVAKYRAQELRTANKSEGFGDYFPDVVDSMKKGIGHLPLGLGPDEWEEISDAGSRRAADIATRRKYGY